MGWWGEFRWIAREGSTRAVLCEIDNTIGKQSWKRRRIPDESNMNKGLEAESHGTHLVLCKRLFGRTTEHVENAGERLQRELRVE